MNSCIDIHLLRTFVAAYEEANFTKAARRLNATQPGVSVQIATLEASMCTPLFERNARSVTPTVAGRHLYPRALQLIHDLNKAAQEIRALAGAVAGRIAIGMPSALSKAIVPPVLSHFFVDYPQTDVKIVESHSEALLSLIESGELDLAFVTHLADQSAIVGRRVCCDHIVLACGPLSGVEPDRPVHLDAEPRFKIVVPSSLRHALGKILDESLCAGRIVPKQLIEMDGLAATLEFVATTDWVALLPAAAVDNSHKGLGVRFNAIAGDDIAIDYFAVHARTEPPSPAAQAFIDLAAAELNQVVTKWRPQLSVKLPRERSAPPAQTSPARTSFAPMRDVRSGVTRARSAPFVSQTAGE